MKNKSWISIAFSLLSIGLIFSNLGCKDTIYGQGKILYEGFCANCHMENGLGLKGVIPPLAGADYLEENKEQIACIIRYGIAGKIMVNGTMYQQPMAGIPQLNEVEINNIINYINHAWGNNYSLSKVEDVRENLEKCELQ